MRCSASKWWLRTITDVLLFLSVFLVLALMLAGIIPPKATTVSCDDPTIRKAYQKDTISVRVLLAVCLLGSSFMLLLLEWALPPAGLAHDKSSLRSGLRRGWRYITDFLVGGVFMFLLNDLAKTLVAEARPNFWDVCRPNLTALQCQEKYIKLTYEDCTNPFNLSHWRLVDSMKSFPSGHASLSVYSSIFIMVFIHQRMWRRWSLLASPWLQMLWAIWTLVCCQSRVWDNKHFWWDVLAGGLLGAFGAFLTLHYLSNWFERADDCCKVNPSTEVSSTSSAPSPYHLQEEDQASSFSRTSIKRLISNTSETDSHVGHGDRELRDIHGTP